MNTVKNVNLLFAKEKVHVRPTKYVVRKYSLAWFVSKVVAFFVTTGKMLEKVEFISSSDFCREHYPVKWFIAVAIKGLIILSLIAVLIILFLYVRNNTPQYLWM